MKSSLRWFPPLGLLLLALPGCHSPEAAQLRGTEFVNEEDGKTKAVTYVSPEEYERMSPQERTRLNAQVGAKVSLSTQGKQSARPRDLSNAELDQAMARGRARDSH